MKQVLDVFGPWATVRWEDTDPRRLFELWPGKATFWEMTCLLRADWYVVEQQVTTPYIREAVLRHSGRESLLRANTRNVVDAKSVPYEAYDVVITFDPILRGLAQPGSLLAYYVQEHWDPAYRASLRRPIGRYDLFLAHMLDAPDALTALPQAVPFPYLRAPDIVREVFQGQQAEACWVDWRTLASLAMIDTWNAKADQAAERLERLLALPIRYRSDFGRAYYGVTDPPAWGDAMHYLREMSCCRYYVSLGHLVTGAGQGLCDAASLGCLCIGEIGKSFHRLLCHPLCLCRDLSDLPDTVRRLIGSPELQREVQVFQDRALRQHFAQVPLATLTKALALKREMRQRVFA